MARAREGRKNVNMVFHAADDERLAIVIRQDAAQITVQFLAKRFVAQKWTTVLGRKNGVNQNLGEGLRHGLMLRECGN